MKLKKMIHSRRLVVKKLLLISFLLLVPSICSAAITSDTLWEVRTTGSDTNGGCYDVGASGTDYTAQDAAQLSLTDLATDGGGTGLSSVTGGFTSAMIGNCINIASGTGFTVGYYQITAYTDTNNVTIDRSAGASATGGSGKVGGGLLTIQEAVDNIARENVINVKNGTYAETVTYQNDGQLGGEANFLRGYKTTRGEYLTTGTDRPIIDGASTRASAIDCNAKARWVLMNFVLTGATGIAFDCGGDDNHQLFNVRMHTNADGAACDTSCFFIDCELDNNSDKGFDSGSGDPSFFDSYIHDNTGIGVSANVTQSIKTVYDTNGDDGMNCTNFQPTVVRNVFYNNTGDGMDCNNGSSTDSGRTWYNNIFKDNANGITYTSKTNLTYGFNLFHNDTVSGTSEIYIGGDVTGDPLFTDAAGGDFSVGSSSPAIDVGLPQANTLGASSNMGIDGGDHAGGSAGTTSSGGAY